MPGDAPSVGPQPLSESPNRSRRAIWSAPLWAALIFATSCAVIPFQQFVDMVKRWSGSAAFGAWFERFWLVSWFVVVKGWHATEFAILTCLIAAALQVVRPDSRRRNIGVAFLLAVLFAASDEWHQTFVPDRDGNVRDVFIDSGGAAIAAIVMLRKRRRPA